ncbi:hypothetical protein, partial [Pandoraea apista]|uniref:hypothetical protein n=1 Tax=Pandoraea apista TaxID=93218 RepID=UPI001C0EA677
YDALIEIPHSMATAAAPTKVALNPFMVPSPRTRTFTSEHTEPRQKVLRYGVCASAKTQAIGGPPVR